MAAPLPGHHARAPRRPRRPVQHHGLTIALEQIEFKFASADGVISHTDLDLYSRGTGHLRRTLEALGLQRRARDISPGSALSTIWEIEGRPDEPEGKEDSQ